MKNIILLIILLAVGSWYYYDKNGELPFVLKKTEQKDPRIDEIKAQAEKNFPTRLDDRERWIKSQISAMHLLDEKPENIPFDIYAEFLKDSAKQYSNNYTGRLSYVKKQADAYAEIENMFSRCSFSAEEKKMLQLEFGKVFKYDYASQLDVLAQAIEAYGMIKSKSMQIAPKDFQKISPRLIYNLVNSPDKCLVFFEDQIRARHNFLSKKLPPLEYDLRAKIEQKYPDDFVAQLKELDYTIDNVLFVKTQNNIGNDNISTAAENVFKKYVYLKETSYRTYCVYFTTMHGKKVATFPSELLQYLGKKFVLDLGGGEEIKLDNIFLSSDSTMAITVIAADNKVDSMKFVPKEETKAKGVIEVEIVGMNRDNRKSTLSAKLINGELKVDDSDDFRASTWFTTGSLIIERATGHPLGFFEIYPNYDHRIFEMYKDPSITHLLSNTKRASIWEGLNDALSLAKKNTSVLNKFGIVYVEDLKKFTKFDFEKYRKQKKMLRSLCIVNASALSFILQGMYGADARDPILKNVTEKYDPIFVRGSRCTVNVLCSNFFKYLQSVRSELRSNAQLARESTDDLYYDFLTPAKRQIELYRKLDSVIANTVAKSEIKRVIHEDMLATVRDGTYIPPQSQFSKPTSGVISGGLVIKNKGVKRDYNK